MGGHALPIQFAFLVRSSSGQRHKAPPYGGRTYTNVQWSEMVRSFNLLLLGNGGTPPPTRLLMPFVLSADVPDTALGALPDMSVQLRNPGLGERRARGSLH
jgi:hypothetical protein